MQINNTEHKCVYASLSLNGNATEKGNHFPFTAIIHSQSQPLSLHCNHPQPKATTFPSLQSSTAKVNHFPFTAIIHSQSQPLSLHCNHPQPKSTTFPSLQSSTAGVNHFPFTAIIRSQSLSLHCNHPQPVTFPSLQSSTASHFPFTAIICSQSLYPYCNHPQPKSDTIPNHNLTRKKEHTRSSFQTNTINLHLPLKSLQHQIFSFSCKKKFLKKIT